MTTAATMQAAGNRASIYLASASSRRRELLQQIGIGFELVRIDVPEHLQPAEHPQDFVLRLAMEKAEAGRRHCRDAGLPPLPVLGADTAVVVDEVVLGKPNNEAEGLAMLRLLAGREHQVYSGVALNDGEHTQTAVSISRVRFRILDDVEIQAYWDTGEGRDKAGCYAVQGLAAQYIETIEGSYSGIMGLPLFETANLLAAMTRADRVTPSTNPAGTPMSEARE
jgi:septum formation protein